MAVSLRAGLRHLDGVRPRIYGVAFVPGGDLLVSSSARFVRVWSLPEGRELRRFEERDGWISAMVLSPDGESFITGGFAKDEGGFLRARSLRDGRLLGEARTPRAVSCVAAVGEGGIAIVAAGFSERAGPGTTEPPGGPAQVGVWSFAGGTFGEKRTFNGTRPGVSSVALAAGGKTLAWAAHHEGVVRVASIETGEVLHTFSQGLEGVTSVALSAGGEKLAIGSLDGFVELHAVGRGDPPMRIAWPTPRLESPLGIPVRCVALSPDGGLVAASSAETAWDAPAAAAWSASTGKLVREYEGGIEENHIVAFSADGRRLASGDSEGGVKVWDAATGELIPPPGRLHRDRILAVTLGPGGDPLASSGRDGRVKIWPAPPREVLLDHALPEGRVARAVAFGPDSRSLACLVAERDGGAGAATEVHVLSASDGALLRRLDAMPDAWRLAWSAGGRIAVATGSHHESTGALRIHDGGTGQLLEEAVAWPVGILALGWDRAGSRLVLGTMDRVVAVRGGGGEPASFEGHREDATPLLLLGALPTAVSALDWSPDGATVASASFSAVRLWSPASGASRRLEDVHRHRVTGLAHDAAGRWLASSDLEGRVAIRDAASGATAHAWELGGAARVLGWRGESVVLVDAAGRVVSLDLPLEAARAPPPPAVASADGESIRQGRLGARVVARSKVYGRPFGSIIQAVQDTDGSFLVADMNRGLWRVSPEGQADVLATQAGTIGGLRDAMTPNLLLLTRRTLSWVPEDGTVRPFLRDHDIGRMEHVAPDPETGGWIVTDAQKGSLLQVSRGGRVTTLAVSPLLKEARVCLIDADTGLPTVSAGWQVLAISRAGDVRALVRTHQANPLSLANGLVQDAHARDFFFLDQTAIPGLYRLTRQGLLKHVSSLLSNPIGLAQERETGDLVISKNNNLGRRAERAEQSAILRFSGFGRASELEVESWLGTEADDTLAR